LPHQARDSSCRPLRHVCAALSVRRVAEAREFLHEKFIGQTVRAIATNACRLVASRDRQKSGRPRHGVVKRRIEARHLRQGGTASSERFALLIHGEADTRRAAVNREDG